jgi:hypothetical protein
MRIYLSRAMLERCRMVERQMNRLLKSMARNKPRFPVTALNMIRGIATKPARRSEQARLAREKLVEV